MQPEIKLETPFTWTFQLPLVSVQQTERLQHIGLELIPGLPLVQLGRITDKSHNVSSNHSTESKAKKRQDLHVGYLTFKPSFSN